MKLKQLTPLLFSLIIIGCDSSDSSSNITPSSDLTYTGVFIDSAVEGLNFSTATQNGVTNAQGEFTYQLGESVTFSIGSIDFPMTEARAKLTPLDIFKTENVTDTAVTNMLRLLQSLDADGLADNGIHVLTSAHSLLGTTSVAFTDENFDTVINTALSSYGGVNTVLISEESAISHFNESLLSNEMPSNCNSDHALVGAQADFQTYAHGVSGTATIIDNCTIQIENFSYDATAPAVYFYSDLSSDFNSTDAFIIGDELRENGIEYNNESITLTLPNDKTLDDIEYFSVWCIDFSVNFGDLRFEKR